MSPSNSTLKQNILLSNNAIASQNPGIVPWIRDMILKCSPSFKITSAVKRQSGARIPVLVTKRWTLFSLQFFGFWDSRGSQLFVLAHGKKNGSHIPQQIPAIICSPLAIFAFLEWKVAKGMAP